ncbi:hypothetical protein MUA04_03045 [Enterobacteriaceae bacterium H11S18]|uniref:hypothetical protein n=1 Tax=Dryocola clanedunensis TaxID=2925396 RepID=UPI0022F04FED|nr:hypothetical protein [Dryocola clanedunensis]MCT4709176.1 hypothetical protein [Dryocola clanedunensis]
MASSDCRQLYRRQGQWRIHLWMQQGLTWKLTRLARHGMETRCPAGAGQRQPAGSVRSMTARPDARCSLD